MDKYKNALINNASRLDAVTDSCGEITKLANSIVEERSREATITLLKKISEVVDNRSYQIEIKRVAQLVNTNLIEFLESIIYLVQPDKGENTDYENH